MSNATSLRVPKYHHHKGKGLAVVTLNGRDVYLGKYGTAASREEYRRLIAEWCQLRGTQRPTSRRSAAAWEVLESPQYLSHPRPAGI